MSDAKCYCCSDETVSKKVVKHLEKALHKEFELVLPKAHFHRRKWNQICKDIREKDVDWVLIDESHLYRKGIVNYVSAQSSFEKLFTSFTKSSAEGIIILELKDCSQRQAFQRAFRGGNRRPLFIKSLDEIQIVVKPIDHFTIWIEDNHLHSLAHRYLNVPAAGIKEHSTSSPNDLSQFAEMARHKATGVDCHAHAQEIGRQLKKYLVSQQCRNVSSGDLLKEVLSGPTRSREHGPIFLMYENENYFSLPFEFINTEVLAHFDEMWGFQHSVVHQHPHCSPPELNLPKDKVSLRFLLINADPGQDVHHFTLPSSGYVCNKPLLHLPNAAVEIGILENFLKDREKAQLAKQPLIIRTSDFNDWTEIRKKIIFDDIDIVHFVGHSGVENDEVFFHFPLVGNPGNTICVRQLRMLLSSNYPWLLYLSSCIVGHTSAVFRMGQRIPFVIAHRWPLDDGEAPVFARSFYERLMDGYSNPAEALLFSKSDNFNMQASLSAILICGRQYK